MNNCIKFASLATLAFTTFSHGALTLSFVEQSGNRYLVSTVEEGTSFTFNEGSFYTGYAVAFVLPGTFTRVDLDESEVTVGGFADNSLTTGGGAGLTASGSYTELYVNHDARPYVEFTDTWYWEGTANLYLVDNVNYGFHLFEGGDTLTFQPGSYWTQVDSTLQFSGGGSSVTFTNEQLAQNLYFDSEGLNQVAPADVTPATIPEPAASFLVGLGSLGLLRRRR